MPSLGGGAAPARPGTAGCRAVTLRVWAPTPGKGRPRPGPRCLGTASPRPPRLSLWSCTEGTSTAVTEVGEPRPQADCLILWTRRLRLGGFRCVPRCPANSVLRCPLVLVHGARGRSEHGGMQAGRQWRPGPVHGRLGPLWVRANARWASGWLDPPAPTGPMEKLRNATTRSPAQGGRLPLLCHLYRRLHGDLRPSVTPRG